MNVEPDKYRVLIVGSSTATYTEGSEEQSEVVMLQRYLEKMRPGVEWQCSAERIYLTPSMPRRTVAAAKKQEADVVVLRLNSGFFMTEWVVERIRELSPRLYRWTRDAAERWRGLMGGGPRGDDGAGGRLYRVLRWALARTIGTAPRISVAEAIQLVTGTIDDLLRLEDVHVVVRLPSYHLSAETNVKLYEARKSAFDGTVRAHCGARHVPYYSWEEVRERAGDERVIGEDGWHPTTETRDLDARTMAEAVLAAVEGSGEGREGSAVFAR